MSARYGSLPGVSRHYGTTGLGVLGAVIRANTATGLNGPGYLYNDLTPADDASEIRGLILSVSTGATLLPYEDGSFELNVAGDGTYSFTYRLYADGADLGTATSTVTVRAPAVPVNVTAAGVAAIVVTAVGAVSATLASPQPVVVSVSADGQVTVNALGSITVQISGQLVTPTAPEEPMVPWDQWEPYILPSAAACPGATMTMHARMAAVELCRFTRLWQRDLTPIAADGASTNFNLRGPADSVPIALLSVTISRPGYTPVNVPVVRPDDGIQRMTTDDRRPCAYTDGAGGLVVWPAAEAGATIATRAVLRPAVDATQCPEFLFAYHAGEVASGALASLLAMPQQEWTDMKAAAVHAGQFAGRKASLAITVQRGGDCARRAPTTRWF